MQKNTPPAKPKFVQDITSGQKLLAGISGSMFAGALATLVPLVEKLFAPDFLYHLSVLRAAMAAISLFSAGWVGIPQIINLLKFLTDLMEFYKKFTEFNKKDNKE